MEMFENPYICKECGGTCCIYGGGCIFHPNQFIEITHDSIISILKTGIVSIDFWWGNPAAEDSEDDDSDYFAYYLRMRNKKEPIIVPKEIEFFESCIIYNEGCPLELKYRPAEGVHLIPNKIKCAIDNCAFTKHGLALSWLPYNPILTDIVQSNKNNLNYEMHKSSINDLKKLMKGEII